VIIDAFFTVVERIAKREFFLSAEPPRAKTRPILALIILCCFRFSTVVEVVVDYQTILDHDSCHIYVSDVKHL
jgi:hypothetical protein